MVAKAANLAQLLGLDTVTLIAIALNFLRFRQARKQCRKLEGRVRMLRVLLLSSVGGRWITQQQHGSLVELGDLLQVSNVLRDASDLVESYKRSTVYSRIVSRGMATRFRDLRSRVDSCCHLILAVNAFLVVMQLVQPNQNNNPSAPAPSSLVVRAEGHDDDDVVPGVRVPAPSAGDSVHAAESLSTTTTPAHGGDTHVIDIPPFQPERND